MVTDTQAKSPIYEIHVKIFSEMSSKLKFM